jgi:hypothetical protein
MPSDGFWEDLGRQASRDEGCAYVARYLRGVGFEHQCIGSLMRARGHIARNHMRKVSNRTPQGVTVASLATNNVIKLLQLRKTNSAL